MAEPEVRFREDSDVSLVNCEATDLMVVQAAKVSTIGADSLDTAQSAGLIDHLLRNRHGCYSSDTEVLTDEGWKLWPDVRGDEHFLTSSMSSNRVEWQRAIGPVISREARPDEMLRIRTTKVDLLVTEDHKMVSARRGHRDRWDWGLHSASDFEEAEHRVALVRSGWSGDDPIVTGDEARFIGFVLGDGHCPRAGGPTFTIRKDRKIVYLTSLARAVGGRLTSSSGDQFYVGLEQNKHLKMLCRETYTRERDRQIPPSLMDQPVEVLRALVDGFLSADGCLTSTNVITRSTVLRDQLQEVGAKIGVSISSAEMEVDTNFGHGVYQRLNFRKAKSARVGPSGNRDAHVRREPYTGTVYCVTVPNGTLYVRRNGLPVWCGNSPFESSYFRFLIRTPIFVAREFMRHRMASYSERSGRYTNMVGEFYLPGPNRPMGQVGKPSHYNTVHLAEADSLMVRLVLEQTSTEAWKDYLALIDMGVAREVARMVLPVNSFTEFYASMNARGLMNFLSLRIKSSTSFYESNPMYEIQQVAEKMEKLFSAQMPLTYGSFVKHGRVAP